MRILEAIRQCHVHHVLCTAQITPVVLHKNGLSPQTDVQELARMSQDDGQKIPKVVATDAEDVAEAEAIRWLQVRAADVFDIAFVEGTKGLAGSVR